MTSQPTSTTPPATPAPTDPVLAKARWLLLRNGVLGGTVVAALVLAAIMLLVARPDWWRGYAAASVAIVLAAAASLVPLYVGVRGTAAELVQMVMVSTGVRGLVALGLSALAVAAGHYPLIPTFSVLMPYYLALLGIESACLIRGLKLK